MTAAFSFRRMTADDLPQLWRWLQEPHVREHYDDGHRTLDAVRDYYGDAIAGREPTLCYVGAVDGADVAYLQTYRVDAYADYASALRAAGAPIADGDASVDMLIGSPAHVGRGLGAALLAAFIADVVWPVVGAHACWIGPSAANARAIRAYERAGFRFVVDAAVPGEPEPEHVMRLTRPPASPAAR
nr:GNAT family N-acetyltransferase [Kofleriaceae bacterium]